jgi:hypothetical protein
LYGWIRVFEGGIARAVGGHVDAGVGHRELEKESACCRKRPAGVGGIEVVRGLPG